MKSVHRGTTMILYVIAFQERADQSVDFLSVNYTKAIGVGVRERNSDAGTATKVMKGLCSFGIWNLVNHMQDESSHAEEMAMVQALQREQVAKYLLAMAYQSALARDGIILEI